VPPVEAAPTWLGRRAPSCPCAPLWPALRVWPRASPGPCLLPAIRTQSARGSQSVVTAGTVPVLTLPRPHVAPSSRCPVLTLHGVVARNRVFGSCGAPGGGYRAVRGRTTSRVQPGPFSRRVTTDSPFGPAIRSVPGAVSGDRCCGARTWGAILGGDDGIGVIFEACRVLAGGAMTVG